MIFFVHFFIEDQCIDNKDRNIEKTIGMNTLNDVDGLRKRKREKREWSRWKRRKIVETKKQNWKWKMENGERERCYGEEEEGNGVV